MNNCTPGPWLVEKRKTRGEFVITTHIVAENGDHVATVGPCGIDDNAALIAAAPTMFEALQECITSEGAACFSDTKDHPEWMQRRLYTIADIARAAIAKATEPKE